MPYFVRIGRVLLQLLLHPKSGLHSKIFFLAVSYLIFFRRISRVIQDASYAIFVFIRSVHRWFYLISPIWMSTTRGNSPSALLLLIPFRSLLISVRNKLTHLPNFFFHFKNSQRVVAMYQTVSIVLILFSRLENKSTQFLPLVFVSKYDVSVFLSVGSVFGLHTNKAPTQVTFPSAFRHCFVETKYSMPVSYRITMLSVSERGR